MTRHFNAQHWRSGKAGNSRDTAGALTKTAICLSDCLPEGHFSGCSGGQISKEPLRRRDKLNRRLVECRLNPPKADMSGATSDVRFGPEADTEKTQTKMSELSASPTIVDLVSGLFASLGQL